MSWPPGPRRTRDLRGRSSSLVAITRARCCWSTRRRCARAGGSFVLARRDAQRTPEGRPYSPKPVHNRFSSLQRLDQLSGEGTATLGPAPAGRRLRSGLGLGHHRPLPLRTRVLAPSWGRGHQRRLAGRRRHDRAARAHGPRLPARAPATCPRPGRVLGHPASSLASLTTGNP